MDIDIEKIEKGGFPHFMLKEIFEQVNSIYDTIRGRVNAEASEIYLGGISEIIPKMVNAHRIIIIGCGTYCSLVSCAIFGRMQPKTGTTTSSIMNTTKSRQGNKRGGFGIRPVPHIFRSNG